MIDRYKAIEVIINQIRELDIVLSTTGMISRELFLAKDRPGNFYMIGSMGLLSSLGLGLALLNPAHQVFVLDGDGSALMSLGTLPLIAAEAPPNLVHVILDNEAYESTGAQPSISSKVSLAKIGEASGYRSSTQVEDEPTLKVGLSNCGMEIGPHLLVIKAAIAPVKGIPRITHTPEDLRDRFKTYLKDS